MVSSILSSTLLTPALEALGGILATALTGVVVWAIKKYMGIELDKNQQAQAKQIVQAVEEKAMSAVKNCLKPPTGNEKHVEAVIQLRALNPPMPESVAISQVDRAVGSLPNVGATAECKVQIDPNKPAG